MSRDRRDSIFIFQLALAVFFFIQGIVGVIGLINPDVVNFSVVFSLILNVLILFSGVVLLAGCFKIGRADTIRVFTIFIMIVWGIHILFQYIFTGIKFDGGILFSEPTFIEWLPELCKDIIIFASISLVIKKYSRD